MKIAILTREAESNLNTIHNAIPIKYLDVVKKYAYPVIIDSTIDLEIYKKEILEQIIDVDGFILPGGDKISEVDLFIIDYCYKNNLPLLGICLGMQEIATYFNKNSLTPLNTLSHFDLEAKYVHQIEIEKDSYLYNVLNKKIIKVNSRHKYQVTSNDNYEIQATSGNVIESIKVKNKDYILGVQFHPEAMYEYDDNAKLIFDDFIRCCKNIKSNKI